MLGNVASATVSISKDIQSTQTLKIWFEKVYLRSQYPLIKVSSDALFSSCLIH